MDAETTKKTDGLKDQGNAFMKSKDYEKALECYTEAIDIVSVAGGSNCILYSNRSQAFINLKKYEEGMHDAEKAITLKPDWFKGYSHKATALARLGKWEEVLKTAKRGLECVTRDTDAAVLLQNITIAHAGLFEASILGIWQGRVSNAMGGYRQTIEFLPRGELTVSIMHRKQDCKYTVRPLDDPNYFVVYFTLPCADTKTPYIARYLPKGSESETGHEELLLCCNADISRANSNQQETPLPADLEKRNGDGFVLMTRLNNPNNSLLKSSISSDQAQIDSESFRQQPLSVRLKKFAEKYHEILESRNAAEWSEKSVSDPGVMVQALKFQSDIFDLEESVGKDVVDPFFLIAAGVEDTELSEMSGESGLGTSGGNKITKDTREAVMKVKDALMERKMLDEQLLQQKKEIFLAEKEKAKQAKLEALQNSFTGGLTGGLTILDKMAKYPATSMCIAGSALIVSALAIGYLSRKK